jgi:hypothetical protein
VGRMSADTGLRGLDLLDAAIAQIEAHPETWKQGEWRCATGMCVAGWIAQLGGGKWIAPAESALADGLVPEPDDDQADLYMTGTGIRYVTAAYRAARLIGVSTDMDEALDNPSDYRDLFSGGNSLADIKAMRDDLRAHAAGVAP